MYDMYHRNNLANKDAQTSEVRLYMLPKWWDVLLRPLQQSSRLVIRYAIC